MVDKFIGVIIEESLEDKSILNTLKILKTRIVEVNEKHKTPWVRRWTLDDIEVPENQADKIAVEISLALDSKHSWYSDFKNSKIEMAFILAPRVETEDN